MLIKISYLWLLQDLEVGSAMKGHQIRQEEPHSRRESVEHHEVIHDRLGIDAVNGRAAQSPQHVNGFGEIYLRNHRGAG